MLQGHGAGEGARGPRALSRAQGGSEGINKDKGSRAVRGTQIGLRGPAGCDIYSPIIIFRAAPGWRQLSSSTAINESNTLNNSAPGEGDKAAEAPLQAAGAGGSLLPLRPQPSKPFPLSLCSLNAAPAEIWGPPQPARPPSPAVRVRQRGPVQGTNPLRHQQTEPGHHRAGHRAWGEAGAAEPGAGQGQHHSLPSTIPQSPCTNRARSSCATSQTSHPDGARGSCRTRTHRPALPSATGTALQTHPGHSPGRSCSPRTDLGPHTARHCREQSPS